MCCCLLLLAAWRLLLHFLEWFGVVPIPRSTDTTTTLTTSFEEDVVVLVSVIDSYATNPDRHRFIVLSTRCGLWHRKTFSHYWYSEVPLGGVLLNVTFPTVYYKLNLCRKILIGNNALIKKYIYKILLKHDTLPSPSS